MLANRVTQSGGYAWLTGLADSSVDGSNVDRDVFAIRPDYRALLLVADGLRPGPWR